MPALIDTGGSGDLDLVIARRRGRKGPVNRGINLSESGEMHQTSNDCEQLLHIFLYCGASCTLFRNKSV